PRPWQSAAELSSTPPRHTRQSTTYVLRDAKSMSRSGNRAIPSLSERTPSETNESLWLEYRHSTRKSHQGAGDHGVDGGHHIPTSSIPRNYFLSSPSTSRSLAAASNCRGVAARCSCSLICAMSPASPARGMCATSGERAPKVGTGDEPPLGSRYPVAMSSSV